MVFSFFKKPPQKMPERQAARPRAPAVRLPDPPRPVPPVDEVVPLSEPLPDLEFTQGNMPPPKPAALAPSPTLELAGKPSSPANNLDFADGLDDDFTESSVMAIDVEHDIDPLQADVEQAVVLFANGQDAVARSLLESYIHSYPGTTGIRFWQLLFDLLQATDDRPAFDALCVQFAETCETSPPTWREQLKAEPVNAAGPKTFSLQGVLTDECLAPLAELEKAVAQKLPIRLDCGKLVGCDDAVAGRLSGILAHSRRAGIVVELERVEGFLTRLNERLIVGQAEHAQSWLLLLELLQRHGSQDAFEEKAVDFAVTFERSPPSWEALPAGKVATPTARRDDAFHLSGDLKSRRFEELVSFLDASEAPVLDFSGVRRMDFFSAGQLVNRLSPYKLAGREVVIRSPNHLVAELMAVVGLNKQARIIVPKS
jgi:anti-anti-sigma regulatory factor